MEITMRDRFWRSAVISETAKASSTAPINKRGPIMSIMEGGGRICAKDRATVTTIMRIFTLVNGRLTNDTDRERYLLESKIDIKALGNMT